MRVIIAGGSGFLGTVLADTLRAHGHEVTIFTRRVRRSDQIAWSPEAADGGAWVEALHQADAVVNLAGESIAGGRWTAARKRALRESRLSTTRALVRALLRAPRAPQVLMSASAIGIYGTHGDEELTEESPTGTDFLGELGRAWEAEALAAEPVTRIVLLRTGLVLSALGGALPQLARPFRFGVGGPMGSGRQYMSWIHVEDWAALAQWALITPGVTGPLNATAPHPVTNAEFARVLGRVLRRPTLVPAPAFALRLLLGEMADALILGGQRVLPAKAQALSFTFRYPTLEPALRAIYGWR